VNRHGRGDNPREILVREPDRDQRGCAFDGQAPTPGVTTKSIAKFADAFTHTPEREPSQKGARARLDGCPDVAFAAAKRQESGALVGSTFTRGAPAVKKPHHLRVAFERDQVLSVRPPS
jgi:hypothetical protein